MSPDESINCAVRDHEITTEWDHRELAETLHRFAERFNAEFFGGSLPCVFLTFEHARITTLGHYRPGRNAVGAVHEINLNTRHLGRPLFDLLGTLLHEMVHQWQNLRGKPGAVGYHNREFVRRCAALGIPCTGGYRSYCLGYGDPLVSFLRRHGVVIEEEAVHDMPTAPPFSVLAHSSKLRKWRCGCTNIRAARPVKALCLLCEQMFRLME